MMYVCEECGHLFEEGEQKTYKESYGEEFVGCPLCGGNFKETEPCEICGKHSNLTTTFEGKEYCYECFTETRDKLLGLLSRCTGGEIDLICDFMKEMDYDKFRDYNFVSLKFEK